MNRAIYHWIGGVQIDEEWMRDWVEFGIHEAELYLHNQAMYEEFCRRTGRKP